VGATRSLGGTNGITADLSVSRPIRFGPQIFISPAVSSSWANRKYMDRYFGVNAGESIASGLPAFQAHSGVMDVSASLFASYSLNTHWQLLANTGITHLLADAQRTPLNETRWNLSGFFGIGYRFLPRTL
jgi:outer membrane protein